MSYVIQSQQDWYQCLASAAFVPWHLSGISWLHQAMALCVCSQYAEIIYAELLALNSTYTIISKH